MPAVVWECLIWSIALVVCVAMICVTYLISQSWNRRLLASVLP